MVSQGGIGGAPAPEGQLAATIAEYQFEPPALETKTQKGQPFRYGHADIVDRHGWMAFGPVVGKRVQHRAYGLRLRPAGSIELQQRGAPAVRAVDDEPIATQTGALPAETAGIERIEQGPVPGRKVS